MKYAWSIALLVWVSCQHIPAPKNVRKETLIHDVKVETSTGKVFSFRGVVSIAGSRTTLVGLSPADTTIFRIRALGRTIKVEVFESLEGLSKGRLHLFYKTLAPLLHSVTSESLPHSWNVRERDKSSRPTNVVLREGGIILTLSDYDLRDRPRHIIMKHSKFFMVLEVRNAGHE